MLCFNYFLLINFNSCILPRFTKSTSNSPVFTKLSETDIIHFFRASHFILHSRIQTKHGRILPHYFMLVLPTRVIIVFLQKLFLFKLFLLVGWVYISINAFYNKILAILNRLKNEILRDNSKKLVYMYGNDGKLGAIVPLLEQFELEKPQWLIWYSNQRE